MRNHPKKERSDKDLDLFEEQPPKTKELLRLKDLAEKSTGSERAKLDGEIHRRVKRDETSR